MINLQKLNNQVSKRDAGKVIKGVVDTIKHNIAWNNHCIAIAEKGISAKNSTKWNIACKFDNKHWLYSHIGRSNYLLNNYLKESIANWKDENINFKKYNLNDFVFNWGAWYGIPLTKLGIVEMKYKVTHTHSFITPDADSIDHADTFKKQFKQLADRYFNGSKEQLHGWIIDTYSADIGNGSYLEGQPLFDINNQKGHQEFTTNINDEKLSERTLKANPNMWFVYSSADSIAKPLTARDFNVIKNALETNNHTDFAHYTSYMLVPDESMAEKELELLLGNKPAVKQVR